MYGFPFWTEWTREPIAVKKIGDILERVNNFKYLGTIKEEEGGMEIENTKADGKMLEKWEEMQRIAVWHNDTSETEGEDIHNSGRVSNRIWGRNLCYIEYTINKNDEVNDTRMLRWICVVTCKDNIRNKHIRLKRFPNRSGRDDWTCTGMRWWYTNNTFWGKVSKRTFQGKGRETLIVLGWGQARIWTGIII